MNFGLDLLTIVIALTHLYVHVQSDESNPPAWYHLPPNSEQSPYGPKIQSSESIPKSSFVPILSPFQVAKPKSPEEVAAIQLVNVAQEVCFRKFSQIIYLS